MREQIADGCPADIALEIAEDNRHLRPAQLEQHLAADAARGNRLVRVANDGDRLKRSRFVPVSNRPEHSSSLGTVRWTIGRILNVAAMVDVALPIQQSRTYTKAGIGNIGFRAGLDGFLHQLSVIHVYIISLIASK